MEEKVISFLRDHDLKIATAESCTGGLIGATLVNVPGASDVYETGFITYSNEAKQKLLSVSSDTLKEFGAVSAQTAKEMAVGAAKSANAQIGISSTGIAGPGGGSKEKPVGLVYVGIAINEKSYAVRYQFQGDRQQIRNLTVIAALKELLDRLDEAY